MSVAKFIVKSGIELPYRPAAIHRLAGQYDNPMPESTMVYPPVRDYQFGFCLHPNLRFGNCNLFGLRQECCTQADKWDQLLTRERKLFDLPGPGPFFSS
jgi:hypothetical protein